MRINADNVLDAEFERLCDTLADVVAERRQEWRQFAACRTEPVDTFFPRREERYKVDRAKALCASCPVSDDCLTYATEVVAQRFGIWGGVSAHNYRMAMASRAAS
jgi:WhiB family redox-sensing transcriptional regulator